MGNNIQNSNIVDFHSIKKSRYARARSIALDIDTYEKELNKVGVTREEQEEFLKALWAIIVAFIDLGYGVHPTQRVPLPNDLNAEILATVDDFFKNAA